MAAFGGTFTGSQTSDGLTAILVDSRSWSSNDQNYNRANFVRTYTVTDVNGDLVTTIVIPIDTDTVSYDIDVNSNPWHQIVLTTTGTPDLPTITKEFPFGRQFDNKYVLYNVANCGGCGCSGETDLCKINYFYNLSGYAAIQGDGIGYQQNIDAAYTLITD